MNTQIKKRQPQQVKIIIERSEDSYSAYADNVVGIYGQGDSVEEAKTSVLSGIALLKKYNTPKNIPTILKGDYEVVYKFDTESFFNYYRKIFTNAALERMTGINQKQLQHYAAGIKKPRPTQVKKIETALHKLGTELIAVEL
jgi:predicted RNase H-like HicB family nuclease